jgi:hypothetical protein
MECNDCMHAIIDFLNLFFENIKTQFGNNMGCLEPNPGNLQF